MKNTLPTILLAFLATPIFAQPVITTTDLLKVGDVVATQPCATATFNPGSAGANQSWDFSQLAPEGPQDTTFYIMPAGTPYAANYPSSNIVGRFGADGYGYYQVSGDKLFFWGQTDPSSALVLTNPVDLAEPVIQVFPNPADDAVQFSGLETTARVMIQNAAGQLVVDKNIAPNERIGVKELGAGVYCCIVYPEGGKAQFLKLVVRP